MKKKIKGIVILAAAAAVIGLSVGFALTGQAAEDESLVSIAAGKNEELQYATLTSVIGNEITCTLTDSGETKEYEIPVGTTVTTKLGTETTFARLNEGNRIALLLEKGTDVIKAVWIVD